MTCRRSRKLGGRSLSTMMTWDGRTSVGALSYGGDVVDEVGVEAARELLVVFVVADVLAWGVDDEQGRQVGGAGDEGVARERHAVGDVEGGPHAVADVGERT